MSLCRSTSRNIFINVLLQCNRAILLSILLLLLLQTVCPTTISPNDSINQSDYDHNDYNDPKTRQYNDLQGRQNPSYPPIPPLSNQPSFTTSQTGQLPFGQPFVVLQFNHLKDFDPMDHALSTTPLPTSQTPSVYVTDIDHHFDPMVISANIYSKSNGFVPINGGNMNLPPLDHSWFTYDWNIQQVTAFQSSSTLTCDTPISPFDITSTNMNDGTSTTIPRSNITSTKYTKHNKEKRTIHHHNQFNSQQIPTTPSTPYGRHTYFEWLTSKIIQKMFPIQTPTVPYPVAIHYTKVDLAPYISNPQAIPPRSEFDPDLANNNVFSLPNYWTRGGPILSLPFQFISMLIPGHTYRVSLRITPIASRFDTTVSIPNVAYMHLSFKRPEYQYYVDYYDDGNNMKSITLPQWYQNPSSFLPYGTKPRKLPIDLTDSHTTPQDFYIHSSSSKFFNPNAWLSTNSSSLNEYFHSYQQISHLHHEHLKQPSRPKSIPNTPNTSFNPFINKDVQFNGDVNWGRFVDGNDNVLLPIYPVLDNIQPYTQIGLASQSLNPWHYYTSSDTYPSSYSSKDPVRDIKPGEYPFNALNITKFDWSFPAPIYSLTSPTSTQRTIQIDFNARSDLPWAAISLRHLNPQEDYLIKLTISFTFHFESTSITSLYSNYDLEEEFTCNNMLIWTQTRSPKAPVIEFRQRYNIPHSILDTRSFPAIVYGQREYPIVFNATGSFAHFNPFNHVGDNIYMDLSPQTVNNAVQPGAFYTNGQSSSKSQMSPLQEIDLDDGASIHSSNIDTEDFFNEERPDFAFHHADVTTDTTPIFLWSCYTTIYDQPDDRYPFLNRNLDLDDGDIVMERLYSAPQKKYKNCFSDLSSHLVDLHPPALSLQTSSQINSLYSRYTSRPSSSSDQQYYNPNGPSVVTDDIDNATFNGDIQGESFSVMSELLAYYKIDISLYHQHLRTVTIHQGIPLSIHFGANVTQLTPDSMSVLSQLRVPEVTFLVSMIYQGSIQTVHHKVKIMPQTQTASLFTVSLMSLQTLVSDATVSTQGYEIETLSTSSSSSSSPSNAKKNKKNKQKEKNKKNHYNKKYNEINQRHQMASLASTSVAPGITPSQPFLFSTLVNSLQAQHTVQRAMTDWSWVHDKSQIDTSPTPTFPPTSEIRLLAIPTRDPYMSDFAIVKSIKAASSNMAPFTNEFDIGQVDEVENKLTKRQLQKRALFSHIKSILTPQSSSQFSSQLHLEHQNQYINNDGHDQLSTSNGKHKHRINTLDATIIPTSKNQDPLLTGPFTHYQPLVSLDRASIQTIIRAFKSEDDNEDNDNDNTTTEDGINRGPFYVAWRQLDPNDITLPSNPSKITTTPNPNPNPNPTPDNGSDTNTMPKLVLLDQFSQYLRISPINLIIGQEYFVEMCQFSNALTSFEQQLWLLDPEYFNFTSVHSNINPRNTLNRVYIPRPSGVSIQTDTAHQNEFYLNGFDGVWGTRRGQRSDTKYQNVVEGNNDYGRMSDFLTNNDQVESLLTYGYPNNRQASRDIIDKLSFTITQQSPSQPHPEYTPTTQNANDFVSIRRPMNCYRVKFRVADQDTAFCSIQVTIPEPLRPKVQTEQTSTSSDKGGKNNDDIVINTDSGTNQSLNIDNQFQSQADSTIAQQFNMDQNLDEIQYKIAQNWVAPPISYYNVTTTCQIYEDLIVDDFGGSTSNPDTSISMKVMGGIDGQAIRQKKRMNFKHFLEEQWGHNQHNVFHDKKQVKQSHKSQTVEALSSTFKSQSLLSTNKTTLYQQPYPNTNSFTNFILNNKNQIQPTAVSTSSTLTQNDNGLIWKIAPVTPFNNDYATILKEFSSYATQTTIQTISYEFSQSVSSSLTLPSGDYSLLAYDYRSKVLVYSRQITLSSVPTCTSCVPDVINYAWDMIRAIIATPMIETSGATTTSTDSSTNGTPLTVLPVDRTSLLSRSQRQIVDLVSLAVKLMQMAVSPLENLNTDSIAAFQGKFQKMLLEVDESDLKLSSFFTTSQFLSPYSSFDRLNNNEGNSANFHQQQQSFSSPIVYYSSASPYRMQFYKALISTPTLLSLNDHHKVLVKIFSNAHSLLTLFTQLPLSYGYTSLNPIQQGTYPIPRDTAINIFDFRYFLNDINEMGTSGDGTGRSEDFGALYDMYFPRDPIPNTREPPSLSSLPKVQIEFGEVISLVTDSITAYIAAIFQFHINPLQTKNAQQLSNYAQFVSRNEAILKGVIERTGKIDTSIALLSMVHLASFYTRVYFSPTLYQTLVNSNLITSTTTIFPTSTVWASISGLNYGYTTQNSNNNNRQIERETMELNQMFKKSHPSSMKNNNHQNRNHFESLQQPPSNTIKVPTHQLSLKNETIVTQITLQTGVMTIYTIPLVMNSLGSIPRNANGLFITNHATLQTINPTVLSIPASCDVYSVDSPLLLDTLISSTNRQDMAVLEALQASRVITIKVNDAINFALFYSDYGVVRAPLAYSELETTNVQENDQVNSTMSEFLFLVDRLYQKTPSQLPSSSSSAPFNTQSTFVSSAIPSPLFIPILISPYTLLRKHSVSDSQLIDSPIAASIIEQSSLDGIHSSPLKQNAVSDYSLTSDIISINTNRTYQSIHFILAHLTANTDFSVQTAISSIAPARTSSSHSTPPTIETSSTTSSSGNLFHYDESRCKFNPFLAQTQSCTLTLTQFTPSLSLTTLPTWLSTDSYWSSTSAMTSDQMEGSVTPQQASVLSNFFQFSTNFHLSDLLSSRASTYDYTTQSITPFSPDSFLSQLNLKGKVPNSSNIKDASKAAFDNDLMNLQQLISTPNSLGTGSISLLPNLNTIADQVTGKVHPLFDIDSIYWFERGTRTMNRLTAWNKTSSLYYLQPQTPDINPVEGPLYSKNYQSDNGYSYNDILLSKIKDDIKRQRDLEMEEEIVTLSAATSPIFNWFIKPPHIAQFNSSYFDTKSLYTPNIRCEQMRYADKIESGVEWSEDGCHLLGMTPLHFLCYCENSSLVRLRLRPMSNEFAQYIIYIPILIVILTIIGLCVLYPRDLRLTRSSLLRAASKWQHSAFQLHNYPYLVYTYGIEYGRKVAEADHGVNSETLNFILTQTLPVSPQVSDSQSIINNTYLNETLSENTVSKPNSNNNNGKGTVSNKQSNKSSSPMVKTKSTPQSSPNSNPVTPQSHGSGGPSPNNSPYQTPLSAALSGTTNNSGKSNNNSNNLLSSKTPPQSPTFHPTSITPSSPKMESFAHNDTGIYYHGYVSSLNRDSKKEQEKRDQNGSDDHQFNPRLIPPMTFNMDSMIGAPTPQPGEPIDPQQLHQFTNTTTHTTHTFSTTSISMLCVECQAPLTKYYQLFGDIRWFGSDWTWFRRMKKRSNSDDGSIQSSHNNQQLSTIINSNPTSPLSHQQQSFQDQAYHEIDNDLFNDKNVFKGVLARKRAKDGFYHDPSTQEMAEKNIFTSIMSSPLNPITYLPLPSSFKTLIGLSSSPGYEKEEWIYNSNSVHINTERKPKQRNPPQPSRCWKCFLLSSLSNFHSLFRLIYHRGNSFNGVPLSLSAMIFALSLLASLAIPAPVLNVIGIYWAIAVTTVISGVCQVLFHYVLYSICTSRIDLNLYKYAMEVARYHATGSSPYLFYAPVKNEQQQWNKMLAGQVPLGGNTAIPPLGTTDVDDDIPLWAQRLKKNDRDESLVGLTSVSSIRDRPALQLLAYLYLWDGNLTGFNNPLGLTAGMNGIHPHNNINTINALLQQPPKQTSSKRVDHSQSSYAIGDDFSIDNLFKSNNQQYILKTLLHRPPLPYSIPLFNSLYLHTYNESGLNQSNCRCFTCVYNSPTQLSKTHQAENEARSTMKQKQTTTTTTTTKSTPQNQLLSTNALPPFSPSDLFHPSQLNLYSNGIFESTPAQQHQYSIYNSHLTQRINPHHQPGKSNPHGDARYRLNQSVHTIPTSAHHYSHYPQVSKSNLSQNSHSFHSTRSKTCNFGAEDGEEEEIEPSSKPIEKWTRTTRSGHKITKHINNHGIYTPHKEFRPFGCINGNCFCLSDQGINKNVLEIKQSLEKNLKMIKTLENYQNLHQLALNPDITNVSRQSFNDRRYGNGLGDSNGSGKGFCLLTSSSSYHRNSFRLQRIPSHNSQFRQSCNVKVNNDDYDGDYPFIQNYNESYDGNYDGDFDDNNLLDGLPFKINPNSNPHDVYNHQTVQKQGLRRRKHQDLVEDHYDEINDSDNQHDPESFRLSQNQSFFAPTSQFYPESIADTQSRYSFGSQSQFFRSKTLRKKRRKKIKNGNRDMSSSDTDDDETDDDETDDSDLDSNSDNEQLQNNNIIHNKNTHNRIDNNTMINPTMSHLPYGRSLNENGANGDIKNQKQINTGNIVQVRAGIHNPTEDVGTKFTLSPQYNDIDNFPHLISEPLFGYTKPLSSQDSSHVHNTDENNANLQPVITTTATQAFEQHTKAQQQQQQQQQQHQQRHRLQNQAIIKQQPKQERNQTNVANFTSNWASLHDGGEHDLDQLANTTQEFVQKVGDDDNDDMMIVSYDNKNNTKTNNQNNTTNKSNQHGGAIPNFGDFTHFCFDLPPDKVPSTLQQLTSAQSNHIPPPPAPLSLNINAMASTHSQQAQRYEIELAQYTKNQEFLALFRDQLQERDQHQLSLYNELQEIRNQLDQLQQQIVYYEGVSQQISIAYHEMQSRFDPSVQNYQPNGGQLYDPNLNARQNNNNNIDPAHGDGEYPFTGIGFHQQQIAHQLMGLTNRTSEQNTHTAPPSQSSDQFTQQGSHPNNQNINQGVLVQHNNNNNNNNPNPSNILTQKQSISPNQQGGSLLLQNLHYSSQHGLVQQPNSQLLGRMGQSSTGSAEGAPQNNAQVTYFGSSAPQGNQFHKISQMSLLEQSNQLQSTYQHCIQQLESFTAHYLWLKVQAHTKLTQFKQLEQYLDLFKVEYNQKILQHQEAYKILETLYNNYQNALNLSREREEMRIQRFIEGKVTQYLDKINSNTFGGLVNAEHNNGPNYDPNGNPIGNTIGPDGSILFSGKPHGDIPATQNFAEYDGNSVLSFLFSRHYLPLDYQNYQNFGQYHLPNQSQVKIKKKVKFDQRVAVIDHDLLVFIPVGIDQHGNPDFQNPDDSSDETEFSSILSRIDSTGTTPTQYNNAKSYRNNQYHNNNNNINANNNNLQHGYYNSNGNPILISYYEELREEPGHHANAHGDGKKDGHRNDKHDKFHPESGSVDFRSEYDPNDGNVDLHSMFLRRREIERMEMMTQLDKNKQKLLKIIDRHTKEAKIIDIYGRMVVKPTIAVNSTTMTIVNEDYIADVKSDRYAIKPFQPDTSTSSSSGEKLSIGGILGRLFGSKSSSSPKNQTGKKSISNNPKKITTPTMTTTATVQTLSISPQHIYTTLTLPVVQCQNSPVKAIITAFLLQKAHNAVSTAIPTHIHTHFGVLATLHRALFITPHALLAHFEHHYPLSPWFLSLLPSPAYPQQLIRDSYYQQYPHLNPQLNPAILHNGGNHRKSMVARDGFPFHRFALINSKDRPVHEQVLAMARHATRYWFYLGLNWIKYNSLTRLICYRTKTQSSLENNDSSSLSSSDKNNIDNHRQEEFDDQFTTLNKLQSSDMAKLTPQIPMLLPYIIYFGLFLGLGSLWAGSISYLGSEVSEIEWLLCVFLSFSFSSFIFTPVCALLLQFFIIDDGNPLRRYITRCQALFLKEFTTQLEKLPLNARNLIRGDPVHLNKVGNTNVDEKMAYLTEKMVGAMLHFTIRKQQVIEEEKKKYERTCQLRQREIQPQNNSNNNYNKHESIGSTRFLQNNTDINTAIHANTNTTNNRNNNLINGTVQNNNHSQVLNNPSNFNHLGNPAHSNNPVQNINYNNPVQNNNYSHPAPNNPYYSHPQNNNFYPLEDNSTTSASEISRETSIPKQSGSLSDQFSSTHHRMEGRTWGSLGSSQSFECIQCHLGTPHPDFRCTDTKHHHQNDSSVINSLTASNTKDPLGPHSFDQSPDADLLINPLDQHQELVAPTLQPLDAEFPALDINPLFNLSSLPQQHSAQLVDPILIPKIDPTSEQNLNVSNDDSFGNTNNDKINTHTHNNDIDNIMNDTHNTEDTYTNNDINTGNSYNNTPNPISPTSSTTTPIPQTPSPHVLTTTPSDATPFTSSPFQLQREVPLQKSPQHKKSSLATHLVNNIVKYPPLPTLSLSDTSNVKEKDNGVTKEDTRIYRQYLKLVHELAQCKCTCGADEMTTLNAFVTYLGRTNEFSFYRAGKRIEGLGCGSCGVNDVNNQIMNHHMTHLTCKTTSHTNCTQSNQSFSQEKNKDSRKITRGDIYTDGLVKDLKSKEPSLSIKQAAHFSYRKLNESIAQQPSINSTKRCQCCNIPTSTCNDIPFPSHQNDAYYRSHHQAGFDHYQSINCANCSLYFNHHDESCLKTKALYFISTIIHLALTQRFSIDNALNLWQHQKAAIKGSTLDISQHNNFLQNNHPLAAPLTTPIQHISTFSPLDSTSMIASCVNTPRTIDDNGLSDPLKGGKKYSIFDHHFPTTMTLASPANTTKVNNNAPYPGHYAFACQAQLLDQLEPLLPLLIDKFDRISTENLIIERQLIKLRQTPYIQSQIKTTGLSSMDNIMGSKNGKNEQMNLPGAIIFGKAIKHSPLFYQAQYNRLFLDQLNRQTTTFQRRINLAQFQSRLRSRSRQFPAVTPIPTWYQQMINHHTHSKQHHQPFRGNHGFNHHTINNSLSPDLIYNSLVDPDYLSSQSYGPEIEPAMSQMNKPIILDTDDLYGNVDEFISNTLIPHNGTSDRHPISSSSLSTVKSPLSELSNSDDFKSDFRNNRINHFEPNKSLHENPTQHKILQSNNHSYPFHKNNNVSSTSCQSNPTYRQRYFGGPYLPSTVNPTSDDISGSHYDQLTVPNEVSLLAYRFQTSTTPVLRKLPETFSQQQSYLSTEVGSLPDNNSNIMNDTNAMTGPISQDEQSLLFYHQNNSLYSQHQQFVDHYGQPNYNKSGDDADWDGKGDVNGKDEGVLRPIEQTNTLPTEEVDLRLTTAQSPTTPYGDNLVPSTSFLGVLNNPTYYDSPDNNHEDPNAMVALGHNPYELPIFTEASEKLSSHPSDWAHSNDKAHFHHYVQHHPMDANHDNHMKHHTNHGSDGFTPVIILDTTDTESIHPITVNQHPSSLPTQLNINQNGQSAILQKMRLDLNQSETDGIRPILLDPNQSPFVSLHRGLPGMVTNSSHFGPTVDINATGSDILSIEEDSQQISTPHKSLQPIQFNRINYSVIPPSPSLDISRHLGTVNDHNTSGDYNNNDNNNNNDNHTHHLSSSDLLDINNNDLNNMSNSGSIHSDRNALAKTSTLTSLLGGRLFKGPSVYKTLAFDRKPVQNTNDDTWSVNQKILGKTHRDLSAHIIDEDGDYLHDNDDKNDEFAIQNERSVSRRTLDDDGMVVGDNNHNHNHNNNNNNNNNNSTNGNNNNNNNPSGRSFTSAKQLSLNGNTTSLYETCPASMLHDARRTIMGQFAAMNNEHSLISNPHEISHSNHHIHSLNQSSSDLPLRLETNTLTKIDHSNYSPIEGSNVVVNASGNNLNVSSDDTDDGQQNNLYIQNNNVVEAYIEEQSDPYDEPILIPLRGLPDDFGNHYNNNSTPYQYNNVDGPQSIDNQQQHHHHYQQQQQQQQHQHLQSYQPYQLNPEDIPDNGLNALESFNQQFHQAQPSHHPQFNSPEHAYFPGHFDTNNEPPHNDFGEQFDQSQFLQYQQQLQSHNHQQQQLQQQQHHLYDYNGHHNTSDLQHNHYPQQHQQQPPQQQQQHRILYNFNNEDPNLGGDDQSLDQLNQQFNNNFHSYPMDHMHDENHDDPDMIMGLNHDQYYPDEYQLYHQGQGSQGYHENVGFDGLDQQFELDLEDQQQIFIHHQQQLQHQQQQRFLNNQQRQYNQQNHNNGFMIDEGNEEEDGEEN